MSDITDIRDEILTHAARAFFALAWADWADEFGPGTAGNGTDIMDEMPTDIDPAATQAAHRLVERLEKAHGKSIVEIFEHTMEMANGDREETPEMFGHYAAMSALGHGVGIFDAFGQEAEDWLKIPDMEFSSLDLDTDKYPISSDD